MARSWIWPPYAGCGIGAPVAGSAPVMLMRKSKPRSGSSGWSGGLARPSRVWQEEHDWALKVGPSPSRASVEAGAVTQFWVKKLSPTANVRRSSLLRLRAADSKAVALDRATLVSPPSIGLSRSSGEYAGAGAQAGVRAIVSVSSANVSAAAARRRGEGIAAALSLWLR